MHHPVYLNCFLKKTMNNSNDENQQIANENTSWLKKWAPRIS